MALTVPACFRRIGVVMSVRHSCVDDDCGFCHLGHTQPVASTPLELPAVNGPIARAAAPESWSSRGPDRRERPNWRTA